MCFFFAGYSIVTPFNLICINMDDDTRPRISPQSQIHVIKRIKKGSNREVWLAEWSGAKVAAKIIHKDVFQRNHSPEIIEHYIGKLRKEGEMLQRLDHPNIVQMHRVLHTKESSVIIMELMHCNLLNYIKESSSTPKISPDKVVSIALGVARGLEYLHGLSSPVIHRDISPEHILLTEDGFPKIAGFQVAKVLTDVGETCETPLDDVSLYAAPETYQEVKKHKTTYGSKMDIYSFGATLLTVIVGEEPVSSLKKTMEDGPTVSRLDTWVNHLKQIKGHVLEKIIIDCLQDQSSKRPNAQEIVKELKRFEQIPKKALPCGQLAKFDPDNEFERVASQSDYQYIFKVIFLGSSNTGKTSLIQLLRNSAYSISSTTTTLQESFVVQSYRLNSSYLKLTIIDTVGQERFYSEPPNYVRHADGIFLVYDVSDKETFERLSHWMEMIQNCSPDKCKILLVGNKVDLRITNSDGDLVPQENAVRLANNSNLPYMETSAKDLDSINNMLQKMVEMLISSASVHVESIHLNAAGKRT